MNNYGVVLNDIGLRPSLNALQTLVQPVAQALFPVEGATLDDHHTFVVSYRPEQDKGLDMHIDNSDVTLNVCLGEEFTASGLTFCGTMGARSVDGERGTSSPTADSSGGRCTDGGTGGGSGGGGGWCCFDGECGCCFGRCCFSWCCCGDVSVASTSPA